MGREWTTDKLSALVEQQGQVLVDEVKVLGAVVIVMDSVAFPLLDGDMDAAAAAAAASPTGTATEDMSAETVAKGLLLPLPLDLMNEAGQLHSTIAGTTTCSLLLPWDWDGSTSGMDLALLKPCGSWAIIGWWPWDLVVFLVDDLRWPATSGWLPPAPGAKHSGPLTSGT